MLRAQARHHVGVAAGRERHDHRHRPARPVRRLQRGGNCDEGRNCGQDQERSTMHVIPQFMLLAPVSKRQSRKAGFMPDPLPPEKTT
jgi:hypothetical protein